LIANFGPLFNHGADLTHHQEHTSHVDSVPWSLPTSLSGHCTMNLRSLFRIRSMPQLSSRTSQLALQTAIGVGFGPIVSGCACESIVSDAPIAPPEALSIDCACDVAGKTLSGDVKQETQLENTFCVPDAYRANPGSYCSSSDVKQFMEGTALGLLDGELAGTCSTARVQVDCVPVVGHESGARAPSCQGVCQAGACDTTLCSESDLLNGACDCTQGSACGTVGSSPVCTPSFSGHLVVAPDLPLTVGKGQDARDALFSMAGGWLPGSQMDVSMAFDSCAADGTCTTMRDDATSAASGTFELTGQPCPYGSCSLGLHTRVQLADFELTFDVPHTFSNLNVEVFSAPGAVSVGTGGFGFILPGNLLVNVSGLDNGVPKVIEGQLNDFPVLFTIDWQNRRFRIPSLGVSFPGGEASITVQLDGTFGTSFAETFDPSLYIPDVQPLPDADGDGISDSVDNCPLVANAGQEPVSSPVLVLPPVPSGCDVGVLTPPTAEDICFGGVVTLSSDLSGTPPLGTSAVTWTATDSRGNSTTATQTLTNTPALVGSNFVQVTDRGKVQFGSIASLGTSIASVGTDAFIGSLFARGSIDVRDRSRVSGSLVSAGSIRLGSGVAVSPSAVQRGTMPTFGTFPELTVQDFTVGSSNVSLEPGRTRTISSGRFNTIRVASRATLTLGAGDYYLNTLTLEPDSRLVLSGATRLFVRSSLTMRGDIQAGRELPVLVYNGTSQVVLERNFTGQLRAPRARISLGSGRQLSFQGSFFAKEIVVSPAATVSCKAGSSL
jgi:hypothetical protein